MPTVGSPDFGGLPAGGEAPGGLPGGEPQGVGGLPGDAPGMTSPVDLLGDTPPGSGPDSGDVGSPFGGAPAMPDMADAMPGDLPGTVSATVLGVDPVANTLTVQVDGEEITLGLDEVEQAIHGDAVVFEKSSDGFAGDGTIALGAATVAIAPFGLSKLINRRRARATGGETV
jgi:hypothetical protein